MTARSHSFRGPSPPPCAAAFTIVELLVVISIISLLMAILLPALQAGRHAAQDLKCRANLRAVAVDFVQFADPTAGRRRGDSEVFGPKVFRLDDFQEATYRIAEFWDGPASKSEPINPLQQPMMCPSGSNTLERRSGVPCDSGAIAPQRNVSVGFNMRLRMRTKSVDDAFFPVNAFLTDKVLQFPDVPLLFDVDGEQAVDLGVLPYYAAPPLSCPKFKKDGTVEGDIYSSSRFWFPSMRHRGRMNVGFVGGHVLSTPDPLAEAWWAWDYVPDPL
ncbi:MAG: type II secretion system protein [Phycisphaerae bacterium]